MLTPAWFPLRHHPLQSRLWRTRARFVAAACGRGSGKTELARRRVVRLLAVRKPWPDPIYFYALPTREQAKRIAWDKLKQLVPQDWLAGQPSESELIISTKFGSKLYLVGMDKPQRIEGNQWDGGVIDESCDQKPGSFDRSVRPALSHRNGWCWRIGVPKRFGPGAGEFKRFFEESAWPDAQTPGTRGATHEAYTWPSEDILSAEEIAEARSTLDAKDYSEQYGAIWQSTSGLVFYAFDPHLNVREGLKYNPDKPLIIGSDFNVDPMAWVIMQQSKPEMHVIDELWIRNTNTPAALDALHARYSDHKAGWFFFGDATARSRNTRATQSDYAHIRNDKRFLGAQVWYPKANPRIVDRFAACNAHLCNAAGDRRTLISPKCVHLIADLNQRAYKEGSRDPDDEDDVGHITDAYGYVIHYLAPIVPTNIGVHDVGIFTGKIV